MRAPTQDLSGDIVLIEGTHDARVRLVSAHAARRHISCHWTLCGIDGVP
jgi:hypothetical protein